jgi:ATP-dependent helicase HrpA
MGYEQLSLHGLVVVEKRRCHYGPHDPKTARALFIRHALVRGEMNARARFLQKNKSLREELALHEHKRRRRDVLASDAELEAFFEERLPAELFTAKAFLHWYKSLSKRQQEELLYDQATLLRDDASLAERDAFPERLEIGPERFRLHYHFDPASDADGVTLECPLHLLNRLEAARLEWLVPGLLQEKVTALIASLPKSKRRSLVPAGEYARAAIQRLGSTPDGSLIERLCQVLGEISGLRLDRSDFQLEKLPRHLSFLIRVRDNNGALLGQSRALEELVERFADRARREFMARQADQWHRDGLRPDDLEALPEVVTTRGGHEAWPAWVEQDSKVGVRLFDTQADARLAHSEGIKALLKSGLRDQWKYLAKNHGLSRPAQIAWTRVEDISSLNESLRDLSLRRFTTPDEVWHVRDRASFAALLIKVRQIFVGICQKDAAMLNEVIMLWHELSLALASLERAVPNNVADLQSQLDDLLYGGFLADIQADRLLHYPRYLTAMGYRLESLEHDPMRDDQRMSQIRPWWQAYLNYLSDGGWYTAELDRYRWLIEEYRVQIFAQQLGTADKVSPQRLADSAEQIGICPS